MYDHPAYLGRVKLELAITTKYDLGIHRLVV